MQRFTVAIVDSTTPGTALTLAVPFDPSAPVSAFIEELFRRAAKQGLELAPDTHIAALHLDSETGAIIDPGDLLSDVVTDSRNDKLFAVFTRQGAPRSGSDTEGVRHQLETSRLVNGDNGLVIRFITPNLAKKSRLSLPTVTISKSATVKELHELAAHQLGLSTVFAKGKITNECNCNLAKQISEVSGPANKIFIVHGKSIVEHLDHQDSSEAAVDIAIEAVTKGVGSAERKIVRHGGELHLGRYSRPPVVAICSKSRHIPLHARVDDEDTASEDDLKHHVVDLHTSEQPMSASIMSCELHETGLSHLAKDGVIDIFVVNRTTAGTASTTIGRSAIFRARPHWEPSISQSPRGVAMFLSSLRVFTSLVSAADSDRRNKDAILHLMDLISNFPPCVRALLLLIDGKTISPPESAAIAHAVYEALHSALIPTGIIGSDTTRVFEGSRLLFGFILEKARTTKLSSSTAAEDDLPYLASLESLNVRDLKTGEAVLHPVQTKSGLLERSLFSAFDEGGVLAHSHLQPRLAQIETPSAVGRHALLAGGASPTVLIFNVSRLVADYRYPDAGHPQGAFDEGELSQLSHLAEVAARNQLSVHKPTQLASAVAPCLTFDRNAHLAVYTGQQACGAPGESNLVFRPSLGESTMNSTVVEQLIAPIIKQYESDGSAVFDSFGGAVLRLLQAPDELLFFCVDTSASMRTSSDFREVNEQHPDVEPDLCVQDIVDAEVYATVTFDTMKDCLSKYEAFKDMLGILVSENDSKKQRGLASEIIDMYRMLLGQEIVAKHERMMKDRDNARSYFARQAIIDAESTLNGLKAQWAGCQTHHEALQDFLIYRANSSADINVEWYWSVGSDVPARAPPTRLPTLSEDLASVPHELRCPISYALLEDPVQAVDGFTYSRSAIEQWFGVRTSSPMTGLPLQSQALVANDELASAVVSWIRGADMQEASQPPAKKARLSLPEQHAKITFLSKDGAFDREITPETTVADLYQLAFRGMKARFMVFQLALHDSTPLDPSSSLAHSHNIHDGDQIFIRIADENSTRSGESSHSASGSGQAEGHALIKVYRNDQVNFSFWVPRSTSGTTQSIIWKYWRYQYETVGWLGLREVQIWTGLYSNGDGLMTGMPRDHTDPMSWYLKRGLYNGRLEDEPLCGEEATAQNGQASDNTKPLVIKVDVQAIRKTSSREAADLSRLDVLKQMFEAYINRSIAYGYKVHMGLVTFNTTAAVKTSLTHVIENFRNAISNMEAEGDTALWEAVALCHDQLNEYAEKYPQAKKRIVVISDGDDTKSVFNNPAALTFNLREDKVVVDSVSLGNADSGDLRTLSQLTGGYRFKPTSLVNALSMVEMEPFLSLLERPESAYAIPTGAPIFLPAFKGFFDAYSMYRVRTATVTGDNYPARKAHANLEDDFIELAAASMRPMLTSQSSGRSNFRTTRLMNEMRAIASGYEQRSYDVYVSESDMSFWKVVMSGPEGSPYEHGTFLLYLHAGDTYPTFAPEARFVTRMMHPNVNAHGRICHALLSRDWTSDISMTMLLDTIFGLLMQAEVSDPINTTIALDYHHDQVDFAEEVRAHVRKHASKTRDQWKKDLL
ncbi:putative bifunctional E2/E3 enzyme [Cercospora beticola]|uniref:peptidylprolyl isomerase n=1 Tax=Cercospora beticola TaxID=122368 RepID=A0A2G5HD11_CERBT|nr:putative bifunctional E2/E3 enzyme [Cercospora beticola]PIA90444.1 putative bifunctional E2/E3 enzyme [Cercospora beticola]WPB08067.1 hypothetical protein RHO25_012731 [Cercospora beticola]